MATVFALTVCAFLVPIDVCAFTPVVVVAGGDPIIDVDGLRETGGFGLSMMNAVVVVDDRPDE